MRCIIYDLEPRIEPVSDGLFTAVTRSSSKRRTMMKWLVLLSVVGVVVLFGDPSVVCSEERAKGLILASAACGYCGEKPVSSVFFVPDRTEASSDPRAAVAELQKKIRLLNGPDLKREFDVAELTRSLENDLEKVFAFVRDELHFHPYRGALRGGRGALLCGAANDVDRCLLLAEMLRQNPATSEIRFVFGKLTPKQCGQLARRALSSTPGKPGYQDEDIKAVLESVGQTPEQLRESTVILGELSQPYAETFAEGFAADRESIFKGLKSANIEIAGTEADGVESVARRLAAHTWIQVRKSDTWTDLDPSFPEATIGWRPADAKRSADSIPPEEFSRLELKLVLERIRGSGVETEILYLGRRNAVDLAGKVVSIDLMPQEFKYEDFADTKPGSFPLLQLCEKFERFQAVINWGETAENSRVFDLKGRVYASKNGLLAEIGSAPGFAVRSLLSRSKSELSAIRLEMVVHVPGRKPRTEVRYFLDRLEPGTREKGSPQWDPGWKESTRVKLSLFQHWTLWSGTGPLNDAFLFDRIAKLLADDNGVPATILALADGSFKDEWASLPDRVDPLPLSVIGLTDTALYLAQGAFAPGDGACFIDCPSIVICKDALSFREPEHIGYRRAIDIVSAPLGCIAKDVSKGSRARFLYGLLLSEGESATMASSSPTVCSTSAVFAKARAAGIPLLTIGRKTAAQVDSLAISKEAKTRISAELAGRSVIVTPARSVRIGGRKVTAWWRIDPVTGACLGIGETGEGQAVSEGLLVLDHISIPMVDRVMKFVVCFNVGIGSGSSVQEAGSACAEAFMKDYLKQTLLAAAKQFGLNPAKKAAVKEAGKAISPDSALGKLYEIAQRHHGDVKQIKGLKGRVKLLLTFGAEIAAAASAAQQ